MEFDGKIFEGDIFRNLPHLDDKPMMLGRVNQMFSETFGITIANLVKSLDSPNPEQEQQVIAYLKRIATITYFKGLSDGEKQTVSIMNSINDVLDQRGSD